MMDIGLKIKELRVEKGITLKELGENINFNYSNLSKIERGERKPTVELLVKLIHYFNLDLTYFLVEGDDSIPITSEWLEFLEEMNEKEVSLQELKILADTVTKIKNA
jgi:transcriptional regulator with XRE-family HTH domain